MFKRLGIKLFGARITELESQLEALSKKLTDHEETLYYFIQKEQENKEFRTMISHAFNNLDGSVDRVGQLALENHTRLLQLEEAQTFAALPDGEFTIN